jgi:hypothetical protein
MSLLNPFVDVMISAKLFSLNTPNSFWDGPNRLDPN